MNLTDSHCHLDYPETDADALIKAAEEAGVSRMLTISVKLSDFSPVRIAERYPNVFASVGIHPEYAAEEERKTTFEALCLATNHPKVVGLGETGLDYHYNSNTKEEQKRLFRLHLKAAKATGLPVIIHTRDAEEDTLDILKSEATPSLSGVLHCFSSEAFLAEEALKLGFYISASGIITFNKAEKLRQTFKNVPEDRLLIETDSPYLAPVPFRGRANEPAYVVKTAEKLAEIKGISVEKLAETTTRNFLTLFKKAV